MGARGFDGGFEWESDIVGALAASARFFNTKPWLRSEYASVASLGAGYSLTLWADGQPEDHSEHTTIIHQKLVGQGGTNVHMRGD